MFVYTHAAVGAALGAWVKDRGRCIILGATGGVLPDVPMGTQIIYTIVSGADVWKIHWWKPTVIVSDAFHSLPLCALLLVGGWGKIVPRSLALGMIVHSLMDAVSHAVTPDFKATYLWPLPWQLGKWVSVWDYRRSPSSFMPKPLEMAVDALALLYLSFVFWKRRQNGK